MIAAIALIAFVAHADTAPDRSQPPKAGPVKPFTIQQPVDFKLKNGMRVLFLQRSRAPLLDVVATIDAGVGWDSLDLPGLAGWTAGMLTEGAGNMDSIAFSDAENALGATIASEAGPEEATASLHVSSAKAADAMKLFATALLQPRFDDKEWQRVRQQAFGYFMYQANEPTELSGLAGAMAAWGKSHRFGLDPAGTPKALVAVKTSDMKSFWSTHYRPDTTTLVVVGDIDRKALDKMLNDDFGAWTAGGKAPEQPKLAGPLMPSARSVVEVNVPGAPQTVLRVLNPAAADIKPYTPDVEVMNTLLGGSFTSRLNQNLREDHGYTYGAGSHLVLFKNGNVFVARTSVATPVTSPATHELMHELERIHEPATDDDVARARNLASLSVPSAFDNGRVTASVWAGIVAQNVDPKRVQRFMDDAPKVDVKAVKAAADRVVDANKCVVVAVGDMNKIGTALSEYGPVTTYTVDDLLPGLKEAMAALGGPPSGE